MAAQNLESKALNGGVLLAGRQLFGMLLSLASMLVTTRLLGPQKYGQFAIVAGLAAYAVNVGKLGLDVYLIRFQGELSEREVGVSQGLLLAVGGVAALAIAALGPAVGWWYRDPLLCELIWAWIAIMPLLLLGAIPLAVLDRRLCYREAALTELWGQGANVVLSVSIVWFTGSLWGLVAGALAQGVTVLLLGSRFSGIPFAPRWQPDEAKAQIRYGFGYCASMWIWQARDLVNPLLVGKLLGSEAVAFVALALRLSVFVAFAKSAVWRVYLSYLARLAGERDKLKEAIESGLSHQLLITGASFLCFFALAPDLVREVLGPKWLPALEVFPFIAAGVIVNSGFSLYSSALYIDGRNRDVSLFHAAHLLLFACSAWFLTWRLQSIAGIGWAEVAAFASYPLIRRLFRMRFFPIREETMLANLALFLGGIALLRQLLPEPLWLRGGATLFALSLILGAIPANRASCATVLGLAGRRLGFNL